MAKRILNMTPTELTQLSKEDLISAIAGSEGRVLASETIGLIPPLLTDVTNAEFAASLGADLILLNMFDVWNPIIHSLPDVSAEETVREVKRLTGRMVGINLEPVEENVTTENTDTLWAMSKCSLRNCRKCSTRTGNGCGCDRSDRESGKWREQ